MTNKAHFCAFLWLTITVLSWQQIRLRLKGLHNFAFYILIFAFSFQSLTPRPSSFTPNPSPFAPNVIVRNYLRLYICKDTFTNVVSALQNHFFMQNKPNFLDDQMNVSSFIATNYEQRTMNYEIKNKPKTNPIQSQYKPNTKPIRTQFKPNLSYRSLWRSRNKPKFTLIPLTDFLVRISRRY
jgi:hypothetical protein